MLKFIGLIIVLSLLNGLVFQWLDISSPIARALTLTGGNMGYLAVGFLFSVINLTIFPVVRILTIPLRWITLGAFSLVLNAALLWLLEKIIFMIDLGDIAFSLEGFRSYVIAGLILSIINTVAGWFLR